MLAWLTTHSDSRLEKVLVLSGDPTTLRSDDEFGRFLSLLHCLEWNPTDSDQVLSQTHERIIRPLDDPEPSSEVQHGLYLIRGNNVAVVRLVDEELDETINWLEVRGAVVGVVKHS
jgi:U6 snRNA-associated Sm-like protein LSm8